MGTSWEGGNDGSLPTDWSSVHVLAELVHTSKVDLVRRWPPLPIAAAGAFVLAEVGPPERVASVALDTGVVSRVRRQGSGELIQCRGWWAVLTRAALYAAVPGLDCEWVELRRGVRRCQRAGDGESVWVQAARGTALLQLDSGGQVRRELDVLADAVLAGVAEDGRVILRDGSGGLHALGGGGASETLLTPGKHVWAVTARLACVTDEDPLEGGTPVFGDLLTLTEADEGFLAEEGLDPPLHLLDFRDGSTWSVPPPGEQWRWKSAHPGPSGLVAAVAQFRSGSGLGRVCILDPDTRQIIAATPIIPVLQVVWSSCGRYVVTNATFARGTVIVVEAASGRVASLVTKPNIQFLGPADWLPVPTSDGSVTTIGA